MQNTVAYKSNKKDIFFVASVINFTRKNQIGLSFEK